MPKCALSVSLYFSAKYAESNSVWQILVHRDFLYYSTV